MHMTQLVSMHERVIAALKDLANSYDGFILQSVKSLDIRIGCRLCFGFSSIDFILYH